MKLSHRLVTQILIFFCTLTTAASARPGIVQKLSFERLVGEADLIVKGRVKELNTRQARDQRSVTTVVTVSVERQFKGPQVSTVTIEQPGGSVGDLALGVPGLPEFSQGEEVILFLKRQRSGRFTVVGDKQGKFTARIEPPSSSPVVEDFAHRTEALDSFLDRLAKTIKAN